jgi:hypothetical protein
MRMFVDAGQMIRGSAFHLHPRGVVVSLLQVVQLFPRHLRVLELTSEIQGTFLVTANTHGVDRLEPPPEAKVERLPLDTPLDVIRARHESRITEAARAHVAMSRHRQKVGGLSHDELERLKGRPLSASEEAFLREVQGKPEA